MKTQSLRGEGKDRVSGGYSMAKLQSLLLGQKNRQREIYFY
jgi:hypothetical protein